MSKILELLHVGKSFAQGSNNLTILENVSFSLKSGDMVAIVGPSGSGKSTLLQIAGLLDKVDNGNIIIDGIDCSKASDKQRTILRNKKIGFVYQFHHLLPEFTALENIILPQMIAGVNEKTAIKKAYYYLDQFNLTQRAKHLPSELSGGEQQRVAIARALINNPSMLLADEPTGNLDPHTSQQVFSVLLSCVKEHNLATLIVTHNLELAAKMDKRVTIKDGKLIELA